MVDRLFIAEINNAIREVDQQLEAFATDIIADIFTDIVRGNPIDTGRSKASWVASLDTPIEYVATDVTPQNKISATEAEQRSLETLRNIQNYSASRQLFITNGNNYVKYLEAGRSGQAPNGWIANVHARYQGVVDVQINF